MRLQTARYSGGTRWQTIAKNAPSCAALFATFFASSVMDGAVICLILALGFEQFAFG